MPEADLDLLIAAAREAGQIAMGFFQSDNKVWDKGRDDPVTEADYAVDKYLRETLTRARPGYGWLSEETEDSDVRLGREAAFIVDPIDGTRAFVAGETTFAHSLAIARSGVVTDAVVFLPARDLLFAARVGEGATLNSAPITTSLRSEVAGATLLASRPALETRHWPGGVPEVERHFRPSLAYRLCLVGEGRFDAMITLRDSWEWDIAAGALIAAEAGAVVTDRYGEMLSFNTPGRLTAGVLATAPGLHQGFANRLGQAA
ncbi:MAG: 3'(2'),5'-bisphosphate nucleotidase CysQ [Pseudomonadota bacterium]